MSISTEQFFPALPPKEPTEGIDWMTLLDSFDPSTLEERYVNECARRNPYETNYHYDTPKRPVEERLKESETFFRFERRDLNSWAIRIQQEGINQTIYKNTRAHLITAIGSKGAIEYNRREYERLGEEGRKRQAEEYKEWKAEREARKAATEAEQERYFYEPEPVSLHEKIVRIRKGIKGSDGKRLTQRNFARFLEYPVNKYVAAEKTDRWHREPESLVEYELLEKLVLRAHANPYWLFDYECEAWYGEDRQTDSVLQGDEPCVYATPDIIIKWIKAGKPRETLWFESYEEL